MTTPDLIRGQAIVDAVPFGAAGQPNMSPSACCLEDGTFLLAGVITMKAPEPVEEVIYVWHIDANGHQIGAPYIYSDPLTYGKDPGLCRLDGSNALLIASKWPYSGDSSGGLYTSDAVVLNCSGTTPFEVSRTPCASTQRFTGGRAGRFSHYIKETGHAVLSATNSMAVYTSSGVQTGYVASNVVTFGWGVNPENNAQIGMRVRAGSTYTGYEYTVDPGGGLTRTIRPEWAPVENWWTWAANNPYFDTHRWIEFDDDNFADRRWKFYEDGVLKKNEAVATNYYANVTGPMYQLTHDVFGHIYEYEYYTGTSDFFTAVAEVDFSTDPPTRREQLLDYGTDPAHGYAVSLIYGSWTADAYSGRMIIAGNSVSQEAVPDDRYSITYWLVAVTGNVGVMRIQLPEEWREEVDPDGWRKIGGSPQHTQGRLNLYVGGAGWIQEIFSGEEGEDVHPLKVYAGKENGEDVWLHVCNMGLLL